MVIRKELLCLLIAGLSIGAHPLAAQGNCKLVSDALLKVGKIPVHLYMTTEMNGKPRTSETIYTASSIYVKLDGKWTVSPLSPQDILSQQQKNIQSSRPTCRYLKDEPVNGEIAAVFNTHNDTTRARSDSQIWVSKGTGLLLRQETDTESTSRGTKSHTATRYEYHDVKPPI